MKTGIYRRILKSKWDSDYMFRGRQYSNGSRRVNKKLKAKVKKALNKYFNKSEE